MTTTDQLAAVADGLAAAQGELMYRREKAAQAAREAHADGMTEVEIARQLRVNRLTVRRWLGKG